MMTLKQTLIACGLAVASPTPAGADTWMVAEAPAALAVSDAQEGVFRAGAMPAVGAYADNGRHVALGLRLRGGVLRNGPAPGENRADPGYGGLATGTLAARVQLGPVWAELAGGGGVTGRDLVPTVEAGAGAAFALGPVDVGPSARLVRVISRDDADSFGSADLFVLGVDVKWGVDRKPRARTYEPREVVHAAVAERPRPAQVVIAAATATPVQSESDHDRVIDRDTSCAQVLDGCPIADGVHIADGRLVLDERVMFDFGRARVRSAGRDIIDTIATLWFVHPEWKHITVEGHTDVRGTDAFNLALSQRRAERVRDVLLRNGYAPEQVDAVGFGRTRPRVDAQDEDGHHANRRVEFVITWKAAP